MKHSKIILLFSLILMLAVSCIKEEISNHDRLIIGTWDCVDYSDSISNELKGRSPVFISNLYENGYVFKRSGLMWTRNKDGDNKMYTNKQVECKWNLSNDNLQIELVFLDSIEIYDIIELTRKKMILTGSEGFWAKNAKTYVFEKQ
jgi:hypothetical protein